ncbi:cilia- and flagella-associated protein 65 isoform X2 [Scophthalmus maximus]|uniref:cilia- and flagella-associated protein 65 isoform X2 n=1 Tax=Scophthalmus maximus TaxID=52904 RepID=UPI001FA84AED|nr:cilia- and flagella-associated protein 65 isoform X2 [Scophthalmus maximus]
MSKTNVRPNQGNGMKKCGKTRATLAEARGPGAPWQGPTAGEDIKDLGNRHRPQAGDNQRQAPSKSSCSLGLETRPELVWEDWDRGQEFTKTLVLKNIHNKLQKLYLRPPVSKFFTTSIPKIIFLSPGTSFSVPVCFRPLQRCEYEDSIEFQGKEGSIQVRLLATIPCHALEVPDSVLLPLCAVQHSSRTTFRLKNASELQTCFQWVCAAPFQLSPEHGLLKPSQECQITAVFRPQEALVYQQEARCRFGEEVDQAGSCCTVLLQALAKYPCLQLRNPATKEEKEQGVPELRFGSVAVGQSLQRHFDIFNPSPVAASFSLSRLFGGVPLFGSEFTCDVTSGDVVSGGSLRATVTYTPAAVDTVSVEYLSVECRGAVNETLLKLTGSSTGPKVSLSSSVVDFGCVKEGGAVTQTIQLFNSSPGETVYQWDLDCCGHSVFSIQPASGTVRPHSRTTLTSVYRPTRAMAHHRRVACLILDGDPLFLDLIGTCHSELQQPAILKPEHLVMRKLHRQRRQDPPEKLQRDHDVHSDQQGVAYALEESNPRLDSAADVLRTPMEEFYRSCLGCMDPLSSSLSSSPHVSVVPSELLFNQKISSPFSTSPTSSQSVSITNHSRGKLGLVWTVAQDSPFTVSPSSCDLAPLKSTSFRVTYDPRQLDTLHGAQLECFAYYKMDDDLIGERPPCPPWCATVRVIGHSFQPGKQHFIPCCSLKPPQVVFPGLGAPSYQTALLQNCGDLPLTFGLDHSSNPALAESVLVIPNCGLIQPGHHQILTLRSTPTEESPKQGFRLQLQLNAAKHTKELTVVNALEKLCVSLEGDGSLYFQPTHVGSRTQRSHHIRNLSGLRLRFQWRIPEPDQGLISVEPDAGELHPNEISFQTWSFSPLAEETYSLKPILCFWPIQTDGRDKSQLTLTVVGMGSEGFIEAKNAVLDCEETLVGSYRSIEVPLVNNSPCPVSFRLSVQQILLDKEVVHDPETEPSALQLHCDKGTIASHSTMLIWSTFKPYRRTQYLWKISYQTLNANGLVSSPPQPVCEVRAKGVFPTLQVTDVCGGGSMGRLSKKHLRTLFSLDSLNKHLLSNPSSAEPIHGTPAEHSLRSCPSTFTKAMLDFNFSAAPIHSDPSAFVLMFHNPGSILVDWAFLFPEDQHIDLEYWAETGEFSSTEPSQVKGQDNSLFSISPRSGTLQPGQHRAVLFSYSHDVAGTNRFPVLLKLSYGREILLNFQGVTVERNRPYLHFSSNRHVFTSVTIGDCSPPRQVYELYNAGAVPVHYEVDTDVLSRLQMDNFNHPVLCCLSPEGDVPAGQTAMLEWIFSPLEAKKYHMDVPIHIQNGDSTLVRFEGCGFDAPTQGSSNPFNVSDTKTTKKPCVQRVPFPGQVAFLSDVSISLGDVPVCSRSSRILFLTNLSHTDTVHYTWDLPLQSNQQVVQIHPEQGSLCPGESGLCVLTFTPTDYPTVYQLELICQLTLEAALTQYHKALQRWEEERKKEREEFTITEKSCVRRPRHPGSPNIRQDNSRSEPVAASVRKESQFRKYKTLPPICASSSCETVGTLCTKLARAERRARRETSTVQRQPEPPQPALLHLGLTAHSYGLHHYLTHFPDRLDKLHRCLQPVKPGKPETTSSRTSLPARLLAPTHGPEKDVHQHILTTLLWDILDDSTFTQSLITLASKPITYQPTEASPSNRPPICPTSPPSSQPQVPPAGTKAGLSEEHSQVDRQGTAECSLQTQDRLHTERLPADMSEDVLLSTLQNLMMELVRGELDPRIVAVPPVSISRRMSRAMAEEEKSKKDTTGT